MTAGSTSHARRRADRAGDLPRRSASSRWRRARAAASTSRRSTTRDTFSWSLVFGAVSIAVLSFLGFDGISTLAEENKESARPIGRAMVAALLLAGVLFIVQTWVAALLVPDPDALIAKGDPGGTAFYDAAAVAGGAWLAKLTASRPRSRGASRTRWSRRPPPPGCCTRWPATGSCRRFLAKVHPTQGRAGQRDAAGRGRLARRSGSTWHARDDGITLLSHAGELRRAHRVPGAARLGGRGTTSSVRAAATGGATWSRR